MTIANQQILSELAPSPWVVRFSSLIPTCGRVLDVACGSGRHSRYFASAGNEVDAVDIEVSGFKQLPIGVRLLQADIEGATWPYLNEQFEGIIVTNYLHRPIMTTLIASLAPGGALIYETFAAGNEQYGRPTRPDFLLQRGELLEAVRGQLHVIAFEDIYVDAPKPAMVQRIAAVRPR
jgi:SAM-dependent methyltransferase